MEYRVRMRIMLKQGVLDSQGQTICHALHSIGYEEVAEVSMGKCLEMTVQSPDAATLNTRVRDMAEKLLANPVVEDYKFEILSEVATEDTSDEAWLDRALLE